MASMLHPWLPSGYRRLVTPGARPLHLDLPQPLSAIVAPTQLWAAPITLRPGLDGHWVHAVGGTLPFPVTVRIDETDDGRFVVTGLLIGLESRDELTWNALRQVKPASLLAEIFGGFDPMNPMKSRAGTDGIDVASVLWERNRPGGAPRPRITAPVQGRVATDLDAFASTYTRHRAATPHRAMKATAVELSISRATAIRRAAQCRQVGLLPPKETK